MRYKLTCLYIDIVLEQKIYNHEITLVAFNDPRINADRVFRMEIF